MNHPRSVAQRKLVGLFMLLTLGVASLLLPGKVAQADAPQVLVIEAKGPVVSTFADYISRGIDQANQQHAEAVILMLDTPGGSVDVTFDLIQKIRNSGVPVVVFVGPRGAKAASAGLLITLAGHAAAMAPDTAIGASSPITSGGQDLPDTAREKAIQYLSAEARSLAERRGSAAASMASDAVINARAVTATEAHDAKLVDFIAEDLPDLLRQLDGFTVEVNGAQKTLHTAGAQTSTLTMTIVERVLLDLADILTDPNVVFVLLAAGVILLIMEINTPGGWVLGTAGVICLGLALFGLGILPVNWLGMVFIVLAFVLYFLDIKAPTHGALTAAATASLIAGAVILLGTPEVRPFGELSLPLVISVSIMLGAIFLFLVIMAVRAQSYKVVTGLEGLIGRAGRVVRDIDPVGTVLVWGENWQAESLDGQPIVAGTPIEIAEVEGMRVRVRVRS